MESSPKFCYKCGAKIEEGEIYCHKCGTNIKSKESYNHNNQENNRSKEGFIEKIKQKYDMKKLTILIFICLSLLMNCIYTPWIRIFPDSNKIGMGHRNQTQIVYSTIFYKPIEFHDGWSSQEPGEKDSRGVYLGYDYKTMAIHEVMLAGVFLVGYLIVTMKKEE